MLIYHPVHDINHCIYRMLRFLEVSSIEEFSWEQFRLLDFYSLFPQLLKGISPFPRELSPYRKLVRRIPDAYESISNEKRVFHEIMPIQNTAIHNLVAKNIVDAEKFEKQVVARTSQSLPPSLEEVIQADTTGSQEWFQFLANQLPLTDFGGKKGLKQRSELMEYRYDGY